MHSSAKLTAKGQVTVPKAVRTALQLDTGDSIVFRVEGHRAVIAKTPDLLDLAGTLRRGAVRRNSTWDDVIARAERRGES
ncbi:MAG: AbrB/MazE/SpoVT family DNA-binding domain-containing protein [Ilumatobacter sp.]|jgi:antitoxin PrlF|uniref:AbrB/MazE/SpoVT family DNA-binding domain-containing protein n=1 Tax=Ilumatobacter sp. TaxID=1967498 RepID=UPI00391C8F97